MTDFDSRFPTVNEHVPDEIPNEPIQQIMQAYAHCYKLVKPAATQSPLLVEESSRLLAEAHRVSNVVLQDANYDQDEVVRILLDYNRFWEYHAKVFIDKVVNLKKVLRSPYNVADEQYLNDIWHFTRDIAHSLQNDMNSFHSLNRRDHMRYISQRTLNTKTVKESTEALLQVVIQDPTLIRPLFGDLTGRMTGQEAAPLAQSTMSRLTNEEAAPLILSAALRLTDPQKVELVNAMMQGSPGFQATFDQHVADKARRLIASANDAAAGGAPPAGGGGHTAAVGGGAPPAGGGGHAVAGGGAAAAGDAGGGAGMVGSRRRRDGNDNDGSPPTRQRMDSS